MRSLVALMLLVTALSACDRTPPGSETPGAPATAAPAVPTPVTAIDAPGLAALLAQNRGQVVLVNFWATWCAPCLREIPELVRMEQTLGPLGFRLIGVSLDEAGSAATVEQFRDEWFPAFHTYQAGDEWYTLASVIEPDWSSVLPTSFVLDRNGELAATLTGGQSYERFAAAVEPLL